MLIDLSFFANGIRFSQEGLFLYALRKFEKELFYVKGSCRRCAEWDM
jgi:hypothetical protein